MHKVLVSIGTNTDTCFNMKRATDHLYACFPSIRFTTVAKTEPCGANFKGPFLNALAYFESKLTKEEILLRFKNIEKSMGRQPSHKAEGVVIIDIDLIQWDNEILKPEDLERDFMQELLVQVQDIINN